MPLVELGPRPRHVSIVVDTPGWFDDHAQRLVRDIEERGDRAAFLRSSAEVPEGGIAFYLSCLKITPPETLARSRLNVVVHASALPLGRGFSPVVWQILEGRNEIPISMIVASEQVDAGEMLMRDAIRFEGHELNDEVRDALGAKICAMCLDLLSRDAVQSQPQEGESSWYRRRRPADSRLDPDRTLAEQFDLLRVVDNERYPAFFDHRGHRYTLTITKVGPAEEETPPPAKA